VESLSYNKTGVVGGELIGMSLGNYGPSTLDCPVNPCEFLSISRKVWLALECAPLPANRV
jgi:hypothetical protein